MIRSELDKNVAVEEKYQNVDNKELDFLGDIISIFALNVGQYWDHQK